MLINLSYGNGNFVMVISFTVVFHVLEFSGLSYSQKCDQLKTRDIKYCGGTSAYLVKSYNEI